MTLLGASFTRPRLAAERGQAEEIEGDVLVTDGDLQLRQAARVEEAEARVPLEGIDDCPPYIPPSALQYEQSVAAG